MRDSPFYESLYFSLLFLTLFFIQVFGVVWAINCPPRKLDGLHTN